MCQRKQQAGQANRSSLTVRVPGPEARLPPLGDGALEVRRLVHLLQHSAGRRGQRELGPRQGEEKEEKGRGGADALIHDWSNAVSIP